MKKYWKRFKNQHVEIEIQFLVAGDHLSEKIKKDLKIFEKICIENEVSPVLKIMSMIENYNDYMEEDKNEFAWCGECGETFFKKEMERVIDITNPNNKYVCKNCLE